MKVERILFPTDFSEGSKHALHCAVDLAEHYNAKLYILHVVYDVTRAIGMHVPHISSDQLFDELNEWAMNEIGKCCIEEIRGLQDVEKRVVKGIPYEEILKFADDEKSDLIVMGTYGRVGVQRFIFGNTAERVVRRAPCPVMTVRVPEHREKKVKKPRPMKVFLSEDAFMGLLLSSAEVFRNESLGYLLGYRLDDRFIVEHAFSLQTARRRRRGVMLRQRDQKKIEPILSNFVKLQIVGDFHSHTQYGGKKGVPVPSPEDIREMEKGNLYIIVAINELEKSKSWKENKDGSISGSMGDFFFKISAYLSPFIKGVPQKAPIYCPFPPGLKVG